MGNLAAGATETLTIVLSVDSSAAPGQDVIVSTATLVELNQVDANPANNSSTAAVSIAREAEVQISTSESIDPVVAGSGVGNLVYEVGVRNVAHRMPLG